ncbi:uncharacterized protein lrif1 [Cebidichthys violaceus]|uniref:uncharacterized protein lrif1 n=1 Tax=Cebidichthys violaceus TaxID=271503 RepID=UPI0035CC8712
MYPAMTEKDPVHSGTGVFYQAIPAVGADGRNIMKLIPVQMVNRHFVKSQISQLKTNTPPKALAVDVTSSPGQKAALNPSATEQIFRKHVSLVNALPHQVGSDVGNSLNKHPLQQIQQCVNLLAVVPPMALPVGNSGQSVRPPHQLPVTVKSPAPPRGQCLHILPKSQVRTVAASELPAGNKKHTFTPSANSSPSSGLPSVTFLSPITSVNRGVTPQSDSGLDAFKLLYKITNTTSCGPPSKGSKPHLNLIPNVPQRPNSPIKWSIEEEDNSMAPTHDPIDSSVTSKILRVLAGRENAGNHCKVIIKPRPTLDPINSSVTSDILRVAAERKNAGKKCEVSTKSVTGLSQGKSGEEQENGKQPQQQQSVHLMAIVPLTATPVPKSGKPGRPPSDLQGTVKSPALPRGQGLQIPLKAQVRTVSESELPPGIKKHTFTPSANSSPSSGLPSVTFLSPITSVNRDVTPQRHSALDALKLLCKTSNKTSCGPPSKGSKPHLKLIPNVPQRPNSPIKWSIEEEDDDNSTAPTHDPIDSSVTSEILRVAAERENAGKHCDVTTNPVPGSSQGKSGQGQENPLVMCNGKVFILAKNSSLPYKTGKSDAPIAAKQIVASTQQSLASVAPQKKQSLEILNPNESSQVIDLCDDDAPNDSSQRAASVHMSAVTLADEDNVIFVSYTPPISESQDLRLMTQMARVRETDQAATSSANNVTGQKSLDGTPGALGRRKLGQSMSVNPVLNHTHVSVSAGMDMHDDDCSIVNSQQSTSAQQLESMEVDPSSNGICFEINKDTHNVESSMTSRTSSLAPESCQRADDLLRRIFGITADVKICLQRIDQASVGSLESECIRSVEERQEISSRFKDGEGFLQHLHSTETESCNALTNGNRVKVLTQQELSEDSATPSPHSDVGPLECSHFKENTNSSPKGTCGDVETEPMIGYGEPIDEDFLSTDENDSPDSRDTAGRSQTCANLNANTRRQGRKRKRPTCPCCIAGTQDPAARSSAKSDEPEKGAWTTERTSKKGGRAKASSKDVKTSGSISCLTAKNKHSCKTSEDPAADSLSTASMDSDELKLHEQITRLKELLQEKEAALELMRNGSISNS